MRTSVIGAGVAFLVSGLAIAACSPDQPIDAAVPSDHDASLEGIDAPGLDAHVVPIDAPGLDAPGLDAPGLDAPGLDAPGLDAPGLDAFTSDTPTIPDAYVVPDASCAAVGEPCMVPESCAVGVIRCSGSVPSCEATPTPASAGVVCRAAAGPCDVAELCDGTSTACAPDTR
jgi:hypothetical protein